MKSEERRASAANRSKKCNRYQARENMQAAKQPVSNPGKRATGAKRRKTFNRYQARENMQAAPSGKRGKSCNRYQAR